MSLYTYLSRSFEVSVSGQRQGVTKKKLHTSAGRLRICKKEFFKTYFDLIVTKCPEINQRLDRPLTFSSSYALAKANSTTYLEYCNQIKKQLFRCWTQKPGGLNNFLCD